MLHYNLCVGHWWPQRQSSTLSFLHTFQRFCNYFTSKHTQNGLVRNTPAKKISRTICEKNGNFWNIVCNMPLKCCGPYTPTPVRGYGLTQRIYILQTTDSTPPPPVVLRWDTSPNLFPPALWAVIQTDRYCAIYEQTEQRKATQFKTTEGAVRSQ